MVKTTQIIAAFIWELMFVCSANALDANYGIGEDVSCSYTSHCAQIDTKAFSWEVATSTQSSKLPVPNRAARLQFMSAGEKFGYYLRSTYGLSGIIYSMSGAALSQAKDSVPEWGQGMEGYGKRLGSRYARRTIKYSIEALLGGLLHEDPRYISSGEAGKLRRGLYATQRVFFSAKDLGGNRPAYSRFIAIAGATYLSRQWQPKSERSAGKYISTGSISLCAEAAKHLLAEFWPDIKHWLRR